MSNRFIYAMSGHDTRTENGALSNSSSGSFFVDQFASAANYRGRDFNEVSNDQTYLWEENPEIALRFPFYLRMITRKVKVNSEYITDNVQSGQGARDESFKRLLWIALNHPKEFNQNIWILPIIGRWKDVWEMMFYDKKFGTNCISHEIMFAMLAQGLKMKEHSELVKKFMPRIKSQKKCTTEWTKNSNDLAKEFASFMHLTYAEYNKLKASSEALKFQHLITNKDFDELCNNFGIIPGRALSLLTSSKFLSNHDLVDKYTEWIKKTINVKFNGYPYELEQRYFAKKNRLPIYEKITLNKQFDSLLSLAEDNGGIKGNVWTAIDTSGSMTWTRLGTTNLMPLDVCLSLGVYFASLNKGAFHNQLISFNNESTVVKLSGEFCDKMYQISQISAGGGTNFQSVVDCIIKVRKENPNIPLEDYPQTILVVSDNEFNSVTMTYDWVNRKYVREETNFEAMKRKLYEAFPKEFVDSMKFVWWLCRTDVPTQFPARIEDGGNYMFSGFDGSIVSMLLGGNGVITKDNTVTEKPSMLEMATAALSQEILLKITL